MLVYLSTDNKSISFVFFFPFGLKAENRKKDCEGSRRSSPRKSLARRLRLEGHPKVSTDSLGVKKCYRSTAEALGIPWGVFFFTSAAPREEERSPQSKKYSLKSPSDSSAPGREKASSRPKKWHRSHPRSSSSHVLDERLLDRGRFLDPNAGVFRRRRRRTRRHVPRITCRRIFSLQLRYFFFLITLI